MLKRRSFFYSGAKDGFGSVLFYPRIAFAVNNHAFTIRHSAFIYILEIHEAQFSYQRIFWRHGHKNSCKCAVFKGIIRVFPKCWSYSVECVDEGGWPQQPKVFFLKIALLANASPSKLIRLPAGTSASSLQVLFQISLYPHWLNIGWRLFNHWLRISRYQISAHFTR